MTTTKKATVGFIILLAVSIAWVTDQKDMHFIEHCTSHPSIQTVTCK